MKTFFLASLAASRDKLFFYEVISFIHLNFDELDKSPNLSPSRQDRQEKQFYIGRLSLCLVKNLLFYEIVNFDKLVKRLESPQRHKGHKEKTYYFKDTFRVFRVFRG
jgi:hypothetical protein